MRLKPGSTTDPVDWAIGQIAAAVLAMTEDPRVLRDPEACDLLEDINAACQRIAEIVTEP